VVKVIDEAAYVFEKNRKLSQWFTIQVIGKEKFQPKFQFSCQFLGFYANDSKIRKIRILIIGLQYRYFGNFFCSKYVRKKLITSAA